MKTQYIIRWNESTYIVDTFERAVKWVEERVQMYGLRIKYSYERKDYYKIITTGEIIIIITTAKRINNE